MDHAVLPATHTFIHNRNKPYLPLTPAAERHRTLAGAHFPSTEGIGYWVGLGWLGKILQWFARPKTVTHPSISRGGRESNSWPSSRESNALTRIPRRPDFDCEQIDNFRCKRDKDFGLSL